MGLWLIWKRKRMQLSEEATWGFYLVVFQSRLLTQRAKTNHLFLKEIWVFLFTLLNYPDSGLYVQPVKMNNLFVHFQNRTETEIMVTRHHSVPWWIPFSLSQKGIYRAAVADTLLIQDTRPIQPLPCSSPSPPFHSPPHYSLLPSDLLALGLHRGLLVCSLLVSAARLFKMADCVFWWV